MFSARPGELKSLDLKRLKSAAQQKYYRRLFNGTFAANGNESELVRYVDADMSLKFKYWSTWHSREQPYFYARRQVKSVDMERYNMKLSLQPIPGGKLVTCSEARFIPRTKKRSADNKNGRSNHW